MDILGYFLIFVLGAVVGSFLNVVILRLPKGQSLTGRSACPHCNHRLGPSELAPLLSFLFLFGRCRHCGGRISPRYFFIEVLTGLLFLLVWRFTGPAVSLPQLLLVLKNLAIASTLLTVFAIDFEHYLILDAVVFTGLALVLLLSFAAELALGGGFGHSAFLLAQSLLWAVAAALPFYLIWLFSKGQWMGFGDVKLAFLLGAIFGWPQFLVALAAGIFIGGLVSCVLLLGKRKTLKSRVPLGTFLSLGALLALFFGPALLAWYLSLLGL